MKTALIIALVLLVIGVIIVGVGWMLLQKFPVEKNTLKDATYPYEMDELPQQIKITTLDSRVQILPIEGDEWRVECKETENNPHTVELIDGVLTVKQEGNVRKWYEYIGIFNAFQSPSVTVYLPVQVYESLEIHSTSGSIKVEGEYTFSNAILNNVSGSISCASNVAGAMEVANTSGSITVSGIVSGNLTVKNISGSITTIGGVSGDLKVTNGSGSIDIKNARPISANIKNISGSIDLYNVVCSGACKVDNVNGSIELDRCDAASFDLETTSGGIRGSILSAKVFDCHSTSGGVHVPTNGEGGTFKAQSTSGGIKITIAE